MYNTINSMNQVENIGIRNTIKTFAWTTQSLCIVYFTLTPYQSHNIKQKQTTIATLKIINIETKLKAFSIRNQNKKCYVLFF